MGSDASSSFLILVRKPRTAVSFSSVASSPETDMCPPPATTPTTYQAHPRDWAVRMRLRQRVPSSDSPEVGACYLNLTGEGEARSSSSGHALPERGVRWGLRQSCLVAIQFTHCATWLGRRASLSRRICRAVKKLGSSESPDCPALCAREM